MKAQEGRLFLQDCLDKWQMNAQIDDLVIYKFANKSLCEYYEDSIPTDVSEQEFAAHLHARYVVKFLRFDNVYVAWDISVGSGNGKYPVFRRQVEDFLMSERRSQSMNVSQNARVILFRRDEESVNEFLQNYIFND